MLAGVSRGFCWKYSCRRRKYWLQSKVIELGFFWIVYSKQSNKQSKRPGPPAPAFRRG